MVADLTIVIPARNEAAYLPSLLEPLLDAWPSERVVVVDNDSEDTTTAIAESYGVRLVPEPRVGKGYAVAAGVRAADSTWTFLCDADIVGLRLPDVMQLMNMVEHGVPLARLAIGRPAEAAPITTLLARPLMNACGLPALLEPIGGLALVNRDYLLNLHLPGGWGFDIALSIDVLASAGKIPELLVRGLTHRHKPLNAYEDMANEVCHSVLRMVAAIDWSHDDCIHVSHD